MSAYLIEVGSFLLRWLHVVAAIAWIGESFYFVMLDRALKPPKLGAAGVFGELWSVHGGGFYHKQKYLVAPPQMPEELHWSKWKSYTTWLSGFALFGVLYLSAPKVYLIDPAVAPLSPLHAIALAVVIPLSTWFVYDAICRAVGFRDRLLGLAIGVLVLLLSFAATHLFAGRAAFLIVGAALATIMTANVFYVIIPGQKRMVAALARGETPDPLPGQRGKQRSVHNTYFTLPVVFAMLSNHYASAYAHPHSWLVLVLIMGAGALLRQFFVLWHGGARAWWLLAAGGAVLFGVFVWLAPAATPTAAAHATAPSSSAIAAPAQVATPVEPAGAPDTVAIHGILARHCVQCHSAHPTLLASAPKGTLFDTPAQIEAQAVLIHQQSVVLRIMPPGNLTQLSDADRAAIGRWFEAQVGHRALPPKAANGG